jgi:hypothetical protein
MAHVDEPRDSGARGTAGPALAPDDDRGGPGHLLPGRPAADQAVRLPAGPHSRRTRVILIGDEILSKVGGFLLGNLLTSVIAGVGTYLWMVAWGIPYPLLLGLLIALLDLTIPVAAALRLLLHEVVFRRLDRS